MSNMTDTATVNLFVNGEKAEEAMSRLRTKAQDLKKALDDAVNAGDDKKAQRLQRELNQTNKELGRVESSAKGVGVVLNNLSGTSIHGLQNALKYLKKELRFAKPDTEAWYRYSEEINRVTARIEKLNHELKGGSSLWGKFTNLANDTWASIDLISRGIHFIVDGLHEYVDAYAEMDQEMANVRRFTGMTEEQVSSLNEEFRNIDTRSSRAQLNMLAQEAGRLGLSSQEDVLGFVRAADKINVALDDLGEGATLTLSKLTGIFGDKERYGTEQSLLKVGSVINELSQNCSASAPYLANFAERMGGVGAQANMTIPQIMGFGAVLDANAQKVEASATALSQVIVRLYQDPAKYARVAGLDAQEFATLMREDANAALIMFLETLQKAGGMDQLSPMFKDMGENGSRAITALSILALHIDEVKSQQEAANVAFREGTSIENEFAEQNNTVQASLDKCKNQANEFRVELGEHLYPLLGLFLTTGTATMRILVTLVKWISENKGEVISLTAAVAAYIITINLAIIREKALIAVSTASRAAMLLWTASCKLGAVAVALLSGNLSKARTSWLAFSAVLRANPIGLLVASLTAVVGLLVTIARQSAKTATESERLARAQKKIADAEKEAEANCAAELASLEALYEATQDQTLAMDARLRAVDRLQEQYPEYFGNLSKESILAGNAADAYDRLRRNIVRSAQAKAREGLLAETESEILRVRRDRDRKVSEALADVEIPDRERLWYPNTDEGKEWYINSQDHPEYFIIRRYIEQVRNEAAETLAQLEAERELLYNGVARDVLEDVSSPDVPTESFVTQSPASHTDKDRFAEEKAWRARQEAEARIAYANGQASYSEHMQRMCEIEREYNQMLLDREDVVGQERLSILADYYEAVNKGTIAGNSLLIDEENSSYQRILFNLTESYRQQLEQGNLSAEERAAADRTHKEAEELAELNHLTRLVEMYEEGSAERLQAQQNFQTAQLRALQRHQQEYEKQEADFAKYKEKFFGDNPEEKQQKYDAAFTMLQTVYARELAAAGANAVERLRIEEAFLEAQAELRREYGLEAEEDTRRSMERAVDASVEWLNSDGGKAVTGSLSTLASGMSSIFSGLSTMIQAELEIQTAAINSRYDKEIQLAQGNSFKVAKLEKKKEADIAKAKNEANKKMFAMQVIQAVAQTAQNALAAYGSAAAIPIVGHVLAPVAAAMAMAAGAIQISAIKKQQQASETQGYSKGGFTRPGGVNEPAGIVHAGEWVASQKLLANPVARPLIETLDRVQRTNTIGTLRADDVSRSITANHSLVRIAESDNGSLVLASVAARMSDTVGDLTDRLNEPFVTVNTVTGDFGIKNAEDEYSRLINNKSPKSRRNGYYNK